jgi:hypothetical protein
MTKSAQSKFNEYLDECRETNNAVNEFVKASYENNDCSYSYAAGYYEGLLARMFEELTKQQKAVFLREMREAAIRHEALAQLVA